MPPSSETTRKRAPVVSTKERTTVARVIEENRPVSKETGDALVIPEAEFRNP